MPRVSWLPDILRDAGLHVAVLPKWDSTGTPRLEPNAVICHHTASSPQTSDAAMARLLRDGRSDLRGPLSQLGLQRDGTFVVIASGRANHNGYGRWGNDSIGIEAYNDGRGEPYPPAQYNAYVRGVAAIVAHLDLPLTRVLGHKESDPGRKIDPTFDMGEFRAAVERINQPPHFIGGIPDMVIWHYTGTTDIKSKPVNIAISGGRISPISGATRDAHRSAGVPVVDVASSVDYLKALEEFNG